MPDKSDKPSHNDTFKLQIKEEQLDITKQKVRLGDVDILKETIHEEKTITVPITREELVIEKKVFDAESSDKRDVDTEIIRIPISEERVDISKHKVILNDVSIYNNQFQETEVIEEILKREKLSIKTDGDVEVIDKNTF